MANLEYHDLQITQILHMDHNKTRKLIRYMPLLLVIPLLVIGFYIYQSHIPKCPDDFGTDDAGSAEYLASFDKWTNDFYDANPDASIGDWNRARHAFWVDNKCLAALQRYESAKNGTADPETMEMIRDTIQDAVDNVPTLTEEEIYKNPFVTHIRVALAGYLDGSNKGIEDKTVIDGFGTDDQMKCGLVKFDKSYYKSKFIVWSSEPSKYGGMNTSIVFVDKPDTIFWAYVYRLAGDGEYVLRGFCEDGPPDDLKAKFPDMIRAMVKDGTFPYSL